MKKLIAALTLILAFSINANAQDKSYDGLTAAEKGVKQAAELSEYVGGLDKIQIENFAKLFEYKFQVIDDINATPERKAEMYRAVEGKIRASLDGKQLDRLERDEVFLKKLTH